MIDKLKKYIEKDITQLTFRDISYNCEDIFEASIASGFAGWYDLADIQKKCDFVIEKCELKQNNRLLDLTCGHGEYSKYFSDYGLEVTGVDISEILIEYLKNRFPAISFFKKRMEDLKFQSDYHCVIILGNSLALIDKKDSLKVLKNQTP